MKAELRERETWYNMCLDCGVQENRWSGENFSDCCNVAPTEERALVVPSSESKKGAWRGVGSFLCGKTSLREECLNLRLFPPSEG